MKQRDKPIHSLGVGIQVCAKEQRKYAKKKTNKKLNPRSARIFTISFILQLLFTGVLSLLLGVLFSEGLQGL